MFLTVGIGFTSLGPLVDLAPMNGPSFAIPRVFEGELTDPWWFQSSAVGWIWDQVSSKLIRGSASLLLPKAGFRGGSQSMATPRCWTECD